MELFVEIVAILAVVWSIVNLYHRTKRLQKRLDIVERTLEDHGIYQ